MSKCGSKNIIFFLIVGVFVLYPLSGFATCNEKDMDKIVDEANKEASQALNNFNQVAGSFNTAAEQYLSSCKNPDEKPKYEPSGDVIGKSRSLQGDFGKEELWKYTGYNWEQAEAPATPANCAALLKAVKQYKQVFDNTRVATETSLKNADNRRDKEWCACDEHKEDIMCLPESQAESGVQKSGNCVEFAKYLSEFSSCPLCGIFKVILEAVARVSSVAWHAVSEPLTTVVKAFFLVLLALEVLKAVASMGGAKISSLGKGVLLLCLKAGIAVLLLSNPRYIYGYFLSPVIETGLNMGVAIADNVGAGGHVATDVQDQFTVPSDTFTPSVYTSVISTVRKFGTAAAVMPSVGRGLSCQAWNDKTMGIPNLSMWISGVVMYLVGLMIWLAISFYMIDCTVQIGMLGGLVPLLIACWPFKLTESYSYKGCKMLMNTFFSYFMMGIVLLLGTKITESAITSENHNINDIINAINENDIKMLRKSCELGALQLIILAACAIFAMKLVGQTNDLADQFSKGSGSNIGSKMGGTVASAATNAAKSTAKITGRAASIVGKHASSAIGLTAAANKVGDKVKGAWQKGWAKAGRGVGLGKYQNTQTGSGKGEEEGENKPDNNNENPNNQGTSETPETPDTPETPEAPETPETPPSREE